MSADTIIKPDKETKAETKPGNYFVSNYPPFSFWKEEEVPMVGVDA
jgi:oxygen-independent coproporphyrinogen-3 oxidase